MAYESKHEGSVIDSAIDWVKANSLSIIRAINNLMSTKVDKIAGKGLSTNDYSNEEKQKVANAVPKETGKGLSSNNYTDEDKQKVANAVQKETGKGLSTNDYSNSEKSKLAMLKINLSYDKSSHLVRPDEQATMLIEADSTPTKDSNKLILSKAVYNTTSELEKSVESLGGYILYVTYSAGQYSVTSNKELPTDSDKAVPFYCKFSEAIFPLSHAFTGSWYFVGIYQHYGSDNIHKMTIKVTSGNLSTAVVSDVDIDTEIDGKTDEAPKDSKSYARSNGQWVEVKAILD